MDEKKWKYIVLAVFLAIFSCFSFVFYQAANEELLWPRISPSGPNSPGPIASRTEDKARNMFVENPDQELRLLFFGDLMIDRYVGEKIAAKGMGYIFGGIFSTSSSSQKLEGYDLVAANLEGAVTDGGGHYVPQNAYDFAFPPERVKLLGDYGFNFFVSANNHFSDQGERGIIETRKNLDKLGISYVGCPDRQIAACSARELEIKGKKISLAAFSQVYGLIDADAACEKIRSSASSSDFLVVNMHWGTEYQHQKNNIQQDLAHRLIDCGADVIIGHHPHVIQGVEVYKGKPIFYSLGNFIFDQYFSPATQEGLAVGLSLNGESLAVQMMPLVSVASRAALAEGEKKERMLREILGWSDLEKKYRESLREGSIVLSR